MAVSDELISKLVKATNDRGNDKQNYTIYGTITESGENLYIQLDGSDALTPFESTVEVDKDDRVIVEVRNHIATVTGSTTNPAVSSKRAGSIEASIKNLGDRIDLEVLDEEKGLAARITLLSNKIDSEVLDETNGLASKITQQASSIESLVQEQGKFSTFKQTLEEFSFVNPNGTAKISSGHLSLSGSIKFTDLNAAAQKRITDAEDALDAVSGWAHADDGTYIDGEMIYSDSIYADSIHLGGRLSVYQTKKGSTLGGRFGYTSGFNSEYGIGMWADDEYDTDDRCYIPIEGQCICTDEAARLSYGSRPQVIASSDGNITLDASGAVYLERKGTVVAQTYNDGQDNQFIPGGNNTIYLGRNNKYWKAAYATNYYGSVATATGSDRNLKNSIEELPDKYVKMFDQLKPVRYKLNSGTSDRYHVGYIAQEVEEAMAVAGIDSQEFGGLVKDKNEDGTYTYMLRYGEFDAIRDAKIKQLEARVAALEER